MENTSRNDLGTIVSEVVGVSEITDVLKGYTECYNCGVKIPKTEHHKEINGKTVYFCDSYCKFGWNGSDI